MTPQSRIAALIALLLAVAAHATPAFFHDELRIDVAGGNTELASYGNSFANMSAGQQTPEVSQEITEVADTETAKQPLKPPSKHTAVEPSVETMVAPQQISETAEAVPVLQNTIQLDLAPPLQVSPSDSAETPEQPTQQPAQQLQKSAEKPVTQVQETSKPEIQSPEPEQKPKPKPKPRGSGGQNAVRGTEAGQNSVAGGLADSNPGKAKVQGNAAASNYGGLVMRRIDRRKRSTSISGAVRVSFKIRPDGALTGLRISQSSGSGKLDSLALAQVRRAAPFPPPPPGARTNYSVEIRGK